MITKMTAYNSQVNLHFIISPIKHVSCQTLPYITSFLWQEPLQGYNADIWLKVIKEGSCFSLKPTIPKKEKENSSLKETTKKKNQNSNIELLKYFFEF